MTIYSCVCGSYEGQEHRENWMVELLWWVYYSSKNCSYQTSIPGCRFLLTRGIGVIIAFTNLIKWNRFIAKKTWELVFVLSSLSIDYMKGPNWMLDA